MTHKATNISLILLTIILSANTGFAQTLDGETENERETELENSGLRWNFGGTIVEVSGAASIGFSYKDGETKNTPELAGTLGISREIASNFVLGTEISVSSESFWGDKEEESSSFTKLPIEVVVYSETRYGNLSFGDVGNALEEIVPNDADGADLGAEADVLYVGNFDALTVAASYDFNHMNDYSIAAAYETDAVMVGLGYGSTDKVGYYTISAGTSVADASITASYTANDKGEKSYGAELGYSIYDVQLATNYSFFNDEHTYGVGAAYQLDSGPTLQASWSTTDGIGAGISLEF